MTKEIFVTGYPRSGNTWTNRMLCDLLNAPLQNVVDMDPVWDYSEYRSDDYIVRKTHWYRRQYDEIEERGGYLGNGCKMVWVYRDPRDMTVSIMHYRNLTEIEPVIISIDNPNDPGVGIHDMVNGWLGHCDHPQSYEHLLSQTSDSLERLHLAITGEPTSVENADRVAERHKFAKWADKYPHSMRKGIVGDWKNHFTRADAELFAEKYQDILEILRYEPDDSWVSRVAN